MKTVSRRIFLPLLLVLLAALLTVGISAAEFDVGIPVEAHPELFIGRTMPTHGEGKIAVFLIQFPDYKNDNPDATAAYYNQLYFSAEPLTGNGNPWSGSVAAFYREQSFGKLNLSGQVFDWYTAKHERSHYDSIWSKMELIMEVIAYYEGKGVDFSQFDGDKNGEIDALIYHFAGPIDQDMNEPWYDGVEYSAHVGKTGSGLEVNSFIQIDNKVDKETRNSEKLRRIICHELMHSLGLYDLYGLAWFALEPVEDLMTSDQPFINPYYKMLLGWTDKVRVVTADTLDVQLGLWEETGEALLVTDNYNGVFDEFYIIAYTKYAYTEGEIKIWHVDARLNEEKIAFLYSNLSYSPKPEQGDAHGEIWDYSTYLFMEEISANPQYDRVLNKTHSLYFQEGASLGPGSIPSSDTHDGRYTGIRIDDFKRLETCATMDITFGNRDTAAPQVSDELSLLGFSSENCVRFNEYVYPADNWSQIRVTTVTGETIPARITRSHYLVYEIEIIIEGDIPQDGYLIVLPEGCVRDSSGNLNQAKTIAITPEGIVFEQEKTLMPWYYPDQTRKWEAEIYCFSDAGASVVITTTGEGEDEVKFIEFLKTDADGNVLTHKFIVNPYEKCQRAWPIQTNDGGYLFVLFCREPSYRTYALCIDRDGNLLWHKEPEEFLSASAVAYGDGVLFYQDGGFTKDQVVYLDVRSGLITTTPLNEPLWVSDVFYNGKDLIYVLKGFGSLSIYTADPLTLEVRSKRSFQFDQNIDVMECRMAYNSNGTYTAVLFTKNYGTGTLRYTALSLDSSFAVKKYVEIDAEPKEGKVLFPTFYPDDGFSFPICVSWGNHANTTYHVVRFDRNLNLMWETDIETDNVSFFVTSSNQIMAFASYWSPERQAYLLSYGSEDAFEVVSHTMTHHPAKTATCIAEGQIEHWTCSDCGGYFTDADGKTVTTAAAVILPKAAHVPAAYVDVAPTCTRDGSTGGTYCEICTWELTPRTVVPATGHTSVTDPAVAPTCTANGTTEGSHCSVCRAVLVAQTVVAATGHTAVEDAAVAPTEESEGLTAGSHCGVCDAVISAQQSIPRLEPETTAAPATTEAPVTTEAPATTAAPATTEAPETDAPVTGAPATETPAQTTGENNSSAPASGNIVPVVIAVAAAVVIAVVVVVILKKRK